VVCGFFVKDLSGMWMRFEHDLHSAPYTAECDNMSGSRLITCRTLADWHYKVRERSAVSGNDSLVDDSKCVISVVRTIQLSI